MIIGHDDYLVYGKISCLISTCTNHTSEGGKEDWQIVRGLITLIHMNTTQLV